MHAKNRIPSSGHSTPSPPASPLRSPRYRHGRKSGRFGPFQPGRTIAHRLAWLLLSVLLRRQGIFLFAPLIYISGMLLYMGTVSFDVVPIVKHRPAPGSVYRSPQVYEKLKIDMCGDNSSADAVSYWFLICSFLVNLDGFLDFMNAGRTFYGCLFWVGFVCWIIPNFEFNFHIFILGLDLGRILRNLDNVVSCFLCWWFYVMLFIWIRLK